MICILQVAMAQAARGTVTVIGQKTSPGPSLTFLHDASLGCSKSGMRYSASVMLPMVVVTVAVLRAVNRYR